MAHNSVKEIIVLNLLKHDIKTIVLYPSKYSVSVLETIKESELLFHFYIIFSSDIVKKEIILYM